MVSRTDSMKTLAKITSVNLEKRIASCATAMGAVVSANFYDSQTELLTVPQVGEVWEISLVNGRWVLDRRNDRDSQLNKVYESSRKSENDIYKSTFLVSDGLLRIQDKYGPLFDEDQPWKIHPSRLSGQITTTEVVTARVKSFGSGTDVTVEWPLVSPTKTGTGPGEQGISHVGAIVRAIIDSAGNVLWVSLPGEPLTSSDSPWFIGSGGKTMEELKNKLSELDIDLVKNKEDLDRLEIDLAGNKTDIEEARALVDQAKQDVEDLHQMVNDVEETITFDRGRTTYSIFYPEVQDGAGKPLDAMWLVFDDDSQELKATFIWNGTAWLPYAWGGDALADGSISHDKLSNEIQQRMDDADSKLSQAEQTITDLNSQLDSLRTETTGALNVLDDKMAENEGAIGNLNDVVIPGLQSTVGTLQSDVEASKGRLDEAQGILDTAFPNGDAFDVQSRLEEESDRVVVSIAPQYAISDTDLLPPATGWSDSQPPRTPGTYVWTRNKITYGSGRLETTEPGLLTGNDGSQGDSGEDAVLLRIDSSRGTAFKNNTISTVLSVTVFYGSRIIKNIEELHDMIGSGAYLEWWWRRLDDTDFGLISSSDSRLGNAGFTLTVSPSDVDDQTVFQCVLHK